jgi:hypothetical protein
VSHWGPAESAIESRPTGLAIAAVILTLMGLLFALFGAIFFAAGAFVRELDPELVQAPGMTVDMVAGFVNVFGGVLVALGLAQVIAGIASFAGREWGRFLGIVLALLGLLFGLLLLVASISPGSGANQQQGGLGIGLVLLVGYGFTIVALARAGSYFRARSAR